MRVIAASKVIIMQMKNVNFAIFKKLLMICNPLQHHLIQDQQILHPIYAHAHHLTIFHL